jgi:apolipoprotein N-acyltransferase
MIKSFNKSYITKYFAPLTGGTLYALGFPMKSLPAYFFSPILGMTLFIYSLNILTTGSSLSLKSRVKTVLLFSLSYCLTGYYWIPHTIKEFGEIPFPFNWMIGASFSLIIAPQFIVFLLSLKLIERLKSHNLFIKVISFIKIPYLYFLFLSFLLTFLEYYIPQQFPAHLGHPWIQLAPYLGLAPFFGAPIYSFLSYLISFNLCNLVLGNKKRIYDLSLIAILLVINFSLPLTKVNKENFNHKDRLRLVQANIGNYLKISAESGSPQAIKEVLNQYLELSVMPQKEPVDLVIWPETAFPKLLNSKLLKSEKRFIPQLFLDTINKSHAELFVGGYDKNMNRKFSFESEYNAAFHFGLEGQLKNVYHKMKLIPFGENLPFGYFNKYLASLVKNISFFAKGDNYTLFRTKNDTPFISSICYEILFSSFIRDFLNRTTSQPSFLINLTNDSWYGDTSEPHQHLALAKWRAIEFKLPIVRMTNTGITSVIYDDGTDSQRLHVNEEKKIDLTLYTTIRSKTLFQRLGFHSLSLLVLLMMAILYLFENKLKRTKT